MHCDRRRWKWDLSLHQQLVGGAGFQQRHSDLLLTLHELGYVGSIVVVSKEPHSKVSIHISPDFTHLSNKYCRTTLGKRFETDTSKIEWRMVAELRIKLVWLCMSPPYVKSWVPLHYVMLTWSMNHQSVTSIDIAPHHPQNPPSSGVDVSIPPFRFVERFAYPGLVAHTSDYP